MVLCTDGLANVGLGALDDLKTDDERTAAENFYENLGREVCADLEFFEFHISPCWDECTRVT